MPSAFRYRASLTLVFLVAAGLLAGCSGGPATVDTGSSSDPAASAPPGMDGTGGSGASGGSAGDADRGMVTPPPGVPMPDGPMYNVTVYTSGAVLYIDNLELEFNRRRGIQAFFGFREDDLTQMVRVPWSDISRIDFGGTISETLWDQVRNNREQQNLNREEIFETQITYHDRSVSLFYAVIPKLRGWRNQQIWELGMAGNPAGFRYIEFDR